MRKDARSIEEAVGEDQCRVRGEDAARSFAILRHITMNLLKCGENTKAGLKMRSLKACANDQYRASPAGLVSFMQSPWLVRTSIRFFGIIGFKSG